MKDMKTARLSSACQMLCCLEWGGLAFLLFGSVLWLVVAAGQAHAATYSSMLAASNWVDPSTHARVAWTNGASCSTGYVGAAIDDDITALLPLGFTFNFGGVNYTQVQIMSNGRLQFNNGYCGYGTQTTGPPPTYPYPYPNASVARTMRVYGVDLDATPSGAAGACPTATCYVSYATEGTAPNRRFMVTWVNVPEWGASARTGSFNLQIILEEATGEFVYQFGTSSHPTGGSAQIGWQLTTTDYEVWSTPVVPLPDSAVRFFLPAVAPSGFNAFETSTAAGSVSGVIKTKIAASAFGLDIVALKSGGTAVETAFAGDVKLELVDASAGASCGAYGLIRNLGTLTFTAANMGRKTLAGISETNVWPNARIRMTYPATGVPTITACSTDNFTIRPASFGSVTVSDADSVTAGTAANTRTLYNTAASGGNVHKAGQPFRIAATARNAAGATTANYVGSPAASLTACVLPVAGCTLGALSAGTWSASSGSVTTTSASYSEVGAFTMKLVDTSFAAVDLADGSSAAEMNIESAAFSVGRFVPDHFDLTTASVPQFKTFNDPTCATRSFTYVGQPFGYLTLPQATVTAKNAAGGVTTNYAGALWKLAPAGVAQVYAAVTGTLNTGLLLTTPPNVIATSGGAGTLTASAIDVAFARPNPVPPLTPPAPFTADISLSMSILDDTEDAVSGNGIINTALPALFPSIAFDSGNEIRFGRLVLSNAHGSELLNLPVPIETQYWNGSGFVRNSADACTQLAAANVALAGWQRDLNACETSVALSGRFSAGQGNLKLTKPAIPNVGNTGSVDLTLQLGATASGSSCVGGVATPAVAASQSWLQGRWTGGDYDRNPAARASFGLNRGSKSLIYLREMY